MIANLCFYPAILIVGCVMLIRQCFKEYFISPTYKSRDYIVRNRKRVNLAGRIFTGIVCCIVLIFYVCPAMLDMIHMMNGEYVYCIIEMRSDYKANSSLTKTGSISAYIHPEFVYDPSDSVIQYDSEKAGVKKDRVTLRIAASSYSEGDFYLVRYLPNTTCGEIVCSVSKEKVESYTD